MSLYFDPDHDHAKDGPIFDIPDDIDPACPCEIMHAAAITLDSYGILIRGESGAGKSLLQRTLRREAQALSLDTALVSDDYVKLIRAPKETSDMSDLMAYGPVATRGLQEVRGLGIISVGAKQLCEHAPMHLLVDLCPPDTIDRMPLSQERFRVCLGEPIAHLSVPERSVVEACDLIFAFLSTWKVQD